MEQLQKMLAREPNDVFLNFGLAMEYLREGRQEDAITQFSRVNELDPNYVPAYFQRGNTLIAAGRRDEAKSVLTAGIEVARRTGEGHTADEMAQVLSMLE